MEISAQNIGKKFGKNWIFRNVNFTISKGQKVVITGPNGSGKSTLLSILSGYLTPTEGSILIDGKNDQFDSFKEISYSAPYIELPEEMSFKEFLLFHSCFRTKLYDLKTISERTNLPLDKSIHEFSTGMKQRVQLSTIFYYSNSLSFMDEPTSNLDMEGFNWWKKEVQQLKNSVIMASNQGREISEFDRSITIQK